MARDQENELLSIRDAAGKLGLRPSTLRKWVGERRIATVRIGRLVKITASEIARVIKDGERPRIELSN